LIPTPLATHGLPSTTYAFFLDRDGTLNVDYDYVHRPEEWTWCDGAIEAIRWMNENGYKVIVITNQSGISRGRFTREQVDALHAWVDGELKRHGAWIDAWYVAPWHPTFHEGHHPDLLQERKPGTGLFLQAAERFHIDFSRSVMAGDKISDLQPAIELGMEAVFIRSRHEPDADQNWLKKHRIPIVDRLLDHIKKGTAGS
jgi:D-glycero-D-manno-heptose 1,7-bisphosphate phosphatase